MNEIEALKTEKDGLDVQEDRVGFARQGQVTSERVQEIIARRQTVGLSRVLQAERQFPHQRSHASLSIRKGELR